MDFKKYQHVERFGTGEVKGIEIGTCYVFPKLDGSNGTVWLSGGEVQAGTRKRHLTEAGSNDNHGFYEWATQNKDIKAYLLENPNHRLFGEWLIPHSLKTYRDDAWRNFYVFDVVVDKTEDELRHQGDSKYRYLPYPEYYPALKEHGIAFLMPMAIIRNGEEKHFLNQLARNTCLMKDGEVGEGIVIKNYDYENPYGRKTWAKIVTSEFKEKHIKQWGPTQINGRVKVEELIAEKYTTKALCEKVLAKIESEVEWSPKLIMRLLSTVYHDVVKEDAWNFVKKHKNPTIDFKILQTFVFEKVKEHLPNKFA